MQNVNFKKFIIALTAVFVANSACAADATVGVTATISPECAVTGTTLTFNKLTMLNSATASQTDLADVQAGKVRAICTNGTANVKFIYTSANPDLDGSGFQLRGTDGSTIVYSLHQDAEASDVRIVSSGQGASHPAFQANGEAQDLDISAKVQAGAKRAKKVQAYSDTITVTTSFDA